MQKNMEAMKAFAADYMAKNPRVEQPEKRDRSITIRYAHGIESVDMSKVMPLGRNEYEMIKWFQGAVQLIRNAEPWLEERIRKMGQWSKYRSSTQMFRNVVRDMMATVDPKKRSRMQAELNYSDVHVEIRDAGRAEMAARGYTYQPAYAVQILIDTVGETECAMCMKTGEEIHGCRIREALEALQTRDIGRHTNGCPFEGMNTQIELGVENDADVGKLV